MIKAAYLIPYIWIKICKPNTQRIVSIYDGKLYRFELKIENEHLPVTEGHPSWKICDWWELGDIGRPAM